MDGLPSVSRKTQNSMSEFRVGRFETLIWNVIRPASSFESATLVTSGAAGFSPVESAKVCEFDAPAGRARRTNPHSATSALTATYTSTRTG